MKITGQLDEKASLDFLLNVLKVEKEKAIELIKDGWRLDIFGEFDEGEGE